MPCPIPKIPLYSSRYLYIIVWLSASFSDCYQVCVGVPIGVGVGGCQHSVDGCVLCGLVNYSVTTEKLVGVIGIGWVIQ